MRELRYRLLGKDEKTWHRKLFFRELGRRGNPDSAFILLLASARRHGEGAEPTARATELFGRLVAQYSRGHLTNNARETVKALVETVSAEAGKLQDSKIDLAAGFIHIKGRQAAAGSFGRLRAGFAGGERLMASSPLLSRRRGRSDEEQISLDLGQTVECDLEELPSFFIVPSSATALGEEPLRKFLWNFVSSEAGLAQVPPAGWDHLPCLVGLGGDLPEAAIPAKPERPKERLRPATPPTGPPSRRALYLIGGIAAAAVLAVTVGLLATRGPRVQRESSIATQVGEAGLASPAETEQPTHEEAVSGEGALTASSAEPTAEPAVDTKQSAAVISLLWRKSLGEVLTSSPVDVGETLAFGSRSGAVHCLSKRDGSQRWAFKGPDGFGSSPAEWSGRLFIGCYDGSIYCLDAGDGSQRWRYRTGGKVVCSPAVTEGGRVLVGSFDGALYCISADGELLWRFNAGARIWSSPAVAGSAVLVGDLGGTVHCLDLNTGAARWSKKIGGEIYGSPAVAEGLAYFGSSNGTVVALSIADGDERWRSSRRGSVSSSLALSPGALLVGYEDKALVALGPGDGKTLWYIALPGPVRSRPAPSGSVAAVTCYNGTALLIDTSRGSILGEFTAEGPVYATPLVADEVVYFGDMKGNFIALSATGLFHE